jgi:uncharacterized protein (TIGR02246 family)
MYHQRNFLILVIGIITVLAGHQAQADFVFGTPENLGSAVNSTYLDGVSDISSDGLELYFECNRPGGRGDGDIWVTTRRTLTDPWEQPANLGAPVNGSYGDNGPCITRDGLALYFASGRPGGSGSHDIYVTTRATIEDPWEEPVNLGPIVNSSAFEHAPSISANGLSLVFGSNREKIGTAYEELCYIYVTTRPTINDPWGVPVRLGPTINTGLEYDSDWPSISEDGLSLYFRRWSSDGAALWVATRTSVSDSWNRTVNLGLRGVSPRFSADGSIMYFSSRAYGGYGDADLFQVPIEPVVDLNADGIVDVADMSIMVDNWGTDNSLCDIGPTPFGDGMVDVHDLLILTEYLTKADVEADIIAIEEVLNQYAVAVSTGDLDLFISIHTDDAVNMGPDAPATFGKEELRASVKPLFDNFTSEMTLYPEEAQADGDLGFARGTYTLSTTPKNGGEASFTDGKYLTVCKRQADGSWKISRECYNSNVPPAQ